METYTPWNIIFKYIKKQATSDEIEELNRWLALDSKNEMLMSEAFNICAVADTEFQQFTPDKQKAWQNIDSRISKRQKNTKKIRLMYRYVAAVVILGILFSSLWFIAGYKDKLWAQQYTEIITPLGQKSMVLLPDSSMVWLNSGSSLRYNKNFNHKEREVTLKGEAYFDVYKNKGKRFRVKTGTLNVDVYGTEFNIKNYNDEEIQEITVAEGRVGVSVGNKEIRQLTYGEQAFLNKTTNKISFSKNDPDVISSWKNNELIIDNVPLEKAIRRLERWYGVNINIDREMEGKHNYTFKIKTESFREMLEMLKVITPLEYEINGKEVKIRYAN